MGFWAQDEIETGAHREPGEIAIRIARAAAGVGLESVALYTLPDETGLHTRVADARVRVEDYLDVESIVRTALESNCDSVHPGYGFLSENPMLAARCAEEGLVFVGPSADALEIFGDKVRARNIAASLGVPVIPGSLGAVDSGAAVRALASGELPMSEKSGLLEYPIMLKASAGGGGRGIRVARCEEEVDELFDSCSREAHHAFGDGSVFVERFLERPRHIEVQIIADSEGHTIHCAERDCSVQIRNQKVVEIAPAPNLDEGVRAAMHEAAIELCKGVGYVNVGTVEFLLEGDGRFYFLEMNPRIQVEHTVTEEISGIDLVETQFHIAGGMSLAQIGLQGDQMKSALGSGNRFAVQARVVAALVADVDQQDQQFTAYKEPGGPGVRVDSCAYVGLKPPLQFDPLFAKLICSHGQSLDGALSRTRRALREFHIEGVGSNVEALLSILEHPEFFDSRTGTYVATTALLRDHPELTEQPRRHDYPDQEHEPTRFGVTAVEERNHRQFQRKGVLGAFTNVARSEATCIWCKFSDCKSFIWGAGGVTS